MYHYNAIIRKIIDGDTIEIDIDLGLSVWIRNEKIRLYGIDTPEIYGVRKGSPEWWLGNSASEYVRKLIHESDEIIIETIKDRKEKFGRYLGIVYVRVLPTELTGLSEIRKIRDFYCLNDILLHKGIAVNYTI